MGAVAKGEIFGFAATAGPNRAVFFDLHRMGSFSRALMGSVTGRRVFGLSAGAEVEGLSGLGVNLVGEGLPAHGWIIRRA